LSRTSAPTGAADDRLPRLIAEWPAEEGYRLHDRGEHPELIARAFNKNSLLKDSSLGALLL
jgi:hypothetical protein